MILFKEVCQLEVMTPIINISLESNWSLRGGIFVYPYLGPINRILLTVIPVWHLFTVVTDWLKRLYKAFYSFLCVDSCIEYFLNVSFVVIHFCIRVSLCLNKFLTQLLVLVASDFGIPLRVCFRHLDPVAFLLKLVGYICQPMPATSGQIKLVILKWEPKV